MTVSPLSQRPRWARLLAVGLVAAVCLGGVLAAVLVLVLTPHQGIYSRLVIPSPQYIIPLSNIHCPHIPHFAPLAPNLMFLFSL